MSTFTTLIIDDEPDIRELIAITFERMGIECHTAPDVSRALSLLGERTFHFCITDMKLPDGTGLDLIEYCQSRHSDMPIAMITAHGNADLAVQALKAGAFDFVSKPLDTEKLRALASVAKDLTKVPLSDGHLPTEQTLIGESQAMHTLLNTIRKVAKTQAPIFIHGQSGTGKEMVAKRIHQLSPRVEGPFVPVNCGALPKDLLESEFFGHAKGSFTGASQDKLGLFKAAENGTLFLDEVADLPLEMQAKLLRAIQEKAIRPVGSEQETPVNVRLLSASHQDLSQCVEQGLFRHDLFFRLNVITLNVPSLAERQDDIPKLAQHFIQKYAKEWSMPAISIEPQALDALSKHPLPGNVRQLENILQRAFTMAENDTIKVDDLGLSVHSTPPASVTPSDTDILPACTSNLEQYLENIERKAITQALEATHWNKTAAAEMLGISFRALRYRCKKLDID